MTEISEGRSEDARSRAQGAEPMKDGLLAIHPMSSSHEESAEGVVVPQPNTPRLWIFGLILIFLVSLPFVNPWVRGDGVGYYAYVRSLLISHNLNFDQDWLHANRSFIEGRCDSQGHILPSEYTSTGHLDNHFSIGPALLWAPFLIVTHTFVISANRLGLDIRTDGFSAPYRITMALSTACYGFVGLLLAFDLTRQYFEDLWAFLGTVGIWLASSFPVYMYFNPSWSHAHSAFVVSLFLWYWHRTRMGRTWAQSVALAAISGLMIDVYYLNAIFLLLIVVEAIPGYWQILHSGEFQWWRIVRSLGKMALFAFIMSVAVGPTFVTRSIIYGEAFVTGYPPLNTWFWTSPRIFEVLFSADHGMLTWTPILLPAAVGVLFFSRTNILFGGGLLLSLIVFTYCIASYVNWDGISSFGNRFFVSCTPVFVLGLASFLETIAKRWKGSWLHAGAFASGIVVLVLWNLGFMFQWGLQVIPTRGPVSFRDVTKNQVVLLPTTLFKGLRFYFTDRGLMMRQIENDGRRWERQ
jgi:hypothetical protein